MQASLPPGFPGSSVWDMLAQCEANGDWAADNGDGFYGGLQFLQSTWDGERRRRLRAGTRTRRRARSRSRSRSASSRIYGWVAWPVCSQKLGLR